ncbi:MAG: peptidoglycan DD-metalloendopeptidase family protein [Chloroflexota bacterium]
MRAENPAVVDEGVWMAQPGVEAYSPAEGEVLAAPPEVRAVETQTPAATATPMPTPSPTPSPTLTLAPGATPTPSPVPTQPRPTEPQRYRVEPGDTMYRIAARFGVSPDTILSANGLSNPNSIAVGQTLLVLPVSGVAHQIKQGDSLSSIAALYGVAAPAIAEYNQIGPGDLLQAGQTILVPGGKVPAPQPTATPTPRPTLAPTPTRVPPTPTPTPRPPTATPAPTSRPPASPPAPAAAPAPPPRGNGQLAWPVAGVITQHFGTQGHEGLDIAAATGTPVRAAADGRVVNLQQSQGGYGWFLVIDHGNGIKSLYSHLSGFNVKLGDTVKRGQQVGAVGSTGRATGPHLHFEVRVNDRLVNPLSYL